MKLYRSEHREEYIYIKMLALNCVYVAKAIVFMYRTQFGIFGIGEEQNRVCHFEHQILLH